VRDVRIPVVVISGFLGSGKTTLLQRMLAQPAYAESLVIVNEFGEVGIDHHLLERSDDRTVLLENGCLCCELRGDLQETLVDVTMRRGRGDLPGFDRVFVETSGLADPGPIAQTLFGDRALARDYRLARVVTLVDAHDDEARAAAATIAAHQVASADVVVLSKADLANAAQLREAEAWVSGINEFARLAPAAHGDIDHALLLDAASETWAHAPAAARRSVAHRPGEHPRDIDTVALRFDDPVPHAAFDVFLDTLVRLRGTDLLRVKGILRFDDTARPMVVQGVRHVFDALRPLPDGATAPAASVLVVIARRLPAEHVDTLWRAVRALAAAPPATTR
jgi:G3E family GTPase